MGRGPGRVKIEQLDIYGRPVRQVRRGSVFAESPIIRQPDPTGELAMCAEDQKLVLQQISPPLREVGRQNEAVH